MKSISAISLVAKHVKSKDHVLLVNPPVVETRYSWVRWNQPADLLKIGSFLEDEIGCTVELLDLMKPDSDGKVPEEWLTGSKRYFEIGEDKYPMRRFGLNERVLAKWVADRRAEKSKRLPTQVWLTSFCSYWTEGVNQANTIIRTALPDANLVLLGNIPKYAGDEADQTIANYTVNKSLPLMDQPAHLALYGNSPPPFLGLSLEPKVAIAEMRAAVERKITTFTFFSDDLGFDGGDALIEICEAGRSLHQHVRFHIICGLYPERITPKMAKLFADRKLIAAINIEEASLGKQLDLAAYEQARQQLSDAGCGDPDDRINGFVWIGRPHEDLDNVVMKSFYVLDFLGGLILKPFTPVPGTPEYQTHIEYLNNLPPARLSPHFFPFAELNGITRSEYHDLYRMAAFLNDRVRSRSFDFLAGTLGTDFLRSSLKREVWNLAPSPLRVINQPADL